MTTLLTPDILWVVDGATREIVAQRLPDGTDQPLSADAVTGSGQAVTTAEFDALVLASGLTTGTTYYLTDGPAMWFATGAATYVGVQFEQSGVTYVGDEAIPTPTDVDLPAGTWATRPTSDPDAAGVVCYRRMTDIGTVPGGTVMTWLCGTSTEWHVTAPVDVFNDFTTTTGAQNTTEQALNPKDIPAGLLKAAGEFEIILVGGKTGTTDAVTSVLARLGAAGTTADTLLNGVLSSAVGAGDLARTAKHRYRYYDATNIAATDSQQGNTGYYGSTSSTAAAFPTYAVTCANALKLSCNVKLATAATDSPQCFRICLRLHP